MGTAARPPAASPVRPPRPSVCRRCRQEFRGTVLTGGAVDLTMCAPCWMETMRRKVR